MCAPPRFSRWHLYVFSRRRQDGASAAVLEVYVDGALRSQQLQPEVAATAPSEDGGNGTAPSAATARLGARADLAP